MNSEKIGIALNCYRYKENMNFEDKLEEISNLYGVSALELNYPRDINKENFLQVKTILDNKKIKICSIEVALENNEEWNRGALISPQVEQRNKAINMVIEAMEISKYLGEPIINLCLGQEGFDYVFQNNYGLAWKRLIEGIRICADYSKNIRLSIEYKVRCPKYYCIVNSGGKALSLIQSIEKENVGITLNVANSFSIGENPAEMASILLIQGRLFHLHLNDTYNTSTLSLPVGSVHWPQYLELFYWLKKLDYEGWYSINILTERDEPREGCKASITFINRVMTFMEENIEHNMYIDNLDMVPSNILNSLYRKVFTF